MLEKQAMARGVKEFEEIQMGLEGRKKRKANDDDEDVEPKLHTNGDRASKKMAVAELQDGDGMTVGHVIKKQGFELDESELLRIAKSDRQRHKDHLTDEKAISSKSKLPSFWIPSLTPSLSASEKLPKKLPKLQSVCPASDPNNLHYYSLKTLVTLQFEEEKEEKTRHGEVTRMCPSCRKALSNEVKAIGMVEGLLNYVEDC